MSAYNTAQCLLMLLWTAPTLRHQSAKGQFREAKFLAALPPLDTLNACERRRSMRHGATELLPNVDAPLGP
jgi:hypothetical protein